MASKIYDFSREELLSIINESKTISEVLKKVGLSHKGSNHLTLKRRCEKEGIDLTPLTERSREYCNTKLSPFQSIDLGDILVENSTYDRTRLKQRLLKENLLSNVCAMCRQKPFWKGKPMMLVLDHINGIPNDNRLENLRLLCPNCNSQTDTFCGRRRE